MISHRTLAVVKRETRSQILTRTFVIATITLPLLMLLLMAFMMTLGSVEDSDEAHVTIVMDSGLDLDKPLKARLDEYNFVQNGQYEIVYLKMDADGFAAFIEAEEPALLQDHHRGVFYVPGRALFDKNIQFYSANPQNIDARTKIGGAVNAIMNRHYFRDKDINIADLDFLQKDINVEGVRITKGGSTEESYGNILVASIFVCLLMISNFFVASPMPAVIIGEKANRVAEILVSSMTPQELFTGKLIAGTITGLLQMAIWLVSLWIFIWITTDVLPIPASFQMTLGLPVVAYFLLNHVIGLMTFITIFAGLAAIYDNVQYANTVVIPSIMLVLIPFYASFTLLGNPANSIAETLSLFPFTSLYVMPARIALIDVPATDILIALAVNIAVFYVLLKLMGKIYQVGIMVTGRKPALSEVLAWVRGH
jgi:ABC-2 type transport system permease protein